MQVQQEHDLAEEYLDAQRATVEAVLIGRETLAQTAQQGEQLHRAERLADDTQYTLDKAGRILRGMTWSGWVANMMSKDVVAPTQDQQKPREPPLVYENLPPSCHAAAQAIQNYHVNVNVLGECETEEQRVVCRSICDKMYEHARKQLAASSTNVDVYKMELESDLQELRKRQDQCKPRFGVTTLQQQQNPVKQLDNAPEMGSRPTKASPSPHDDVRKAKQDEHLQFLAENLGELGYIASSLHETVARQNHTMDRLDEKSDNIVEQSKRVTRRADRMVQSKTWLPSKPTLVCRLTVRHIDSGKYLAVVNGDVYLVPRLSENCHFTMWKRDSALFGLKHKASDKWIGQNLLGSLACSASSYGHREDWEADDDWSSSTLLCASARWGAGGYLLVRPRDHAVLIGGSGVAEKKKAAVWCLQEIEE